jgi:hypothetical protein
LEEIELAHSPHVGESVLSTLTEHCASKLTRIHLEDLLNIRREKLLGFVERALNLTHFSLINCQFTLAVSQADDEVFSTLF